MIMVGYETLKDLRENLLELSARRLLYRNHVRHASVLVFHDPAFCLHSKA